MEKILKFQGVYRGGSCKIYSYCSSDKTIYEAIVYEGGHKYKQTFADFTVALDEIKVFIDGKQIEDKVK